MNFSGKMTLSLAGGILLAATVFASDAPGGNPYAQIVARNVFGLNPPAPPAPPKPAEPPPKIMPNGIMSIFGSLQALFKVAVITPGKPPQEKSYMLTEGQREDDIEVTRIDEKNATITFNNHGTIQELPLVAGKAIGGAEPSPVNPRLNGIPIQNHPMGSMNENRLNSEAAIALRNRAMANNGAKSTTYNSGNSGQHMQNNLSNLSSDDRAALIAAQHAMAQQSGNPMAPIFPPTKYDQDAGVVPHAPGAPGAPGNGPPIP